MGGVDIDLRIAIRVVNMDDMQAFNYEYLGGGTVLIFVCVKEKWGSRVMLQCTLVHYYNSNLTQVHACPK